MDYEVIIEGEDFDWRKSYGDFRKKYREQPLDQPLTIRLRTIGFNPLLTMMIARIIFNHQGPVTIEVDDYAFGCGTVWAFLVDELRVDRSAGFGMVPWDEYEQDIHRLLRESRKGLTRAQVNDLVTIEDQGPVFFLKNFPSCLNVKTL